MTHKKTGFTIFPLFGSINAKSAMYSAIIGIVLLATVGLLFGLGAVIYPLVMVAATVGAFALVSAAVQGLTNLIDSLKGTFSRSASNSDAPAPRASGAGYDYGYQSHGAWYPQSGHAQAPQAGNSNGQYFAYSHNQAPVHGHADYAPESQRASSTPTHS